jgi:GrpB-like predicted nucleotidyltransferase (UPF0157 family)
VAWAGRSCHKTISRHFIRAIRTHPWLINLRCWPAAAQGLNDPQLALEYSELKRGLATAHSDDIEAYMDGKDAFIKDVEAKALVWAAA